MLDEEVLHKVAYKHMRGLRKHADFRSRRSNYPHICVQTEMMPDVIPLPCFPYEPKAPTGEAPCATQTAESYTLTGGGVRGR